MPDLHLIQGELGQARRRSTDLAAPWDQVWAQVSTAEGARSWLMPVERGTVCGPGQISGQVPGRVRRNVATAAGSFVRKLLAAEASATRQALYPLGLAVEAADGEAHPGDAAGTAV